jgi:hypothetical protein
MKFTLHTPERWGDIEALVNTRVWAFACCWRMHHHSRCHYRESGKPASLGASPEARRELQRLKVRLRSRT